MDWKKILENLVLAIFTFFTGLIGLLVTRAVKGNWGGELWTYIPLFWMPVLTSWTISIAILLGRFDI
jgi:hypothetical protein